MGMKKGQSFILENQSGKGFQVKLVDNNGLVHLSPFPPKTLALKNIVRIKKQTHTEKKNRRGRSS